MTNDPSKAYLGDGVYVRVDERGLVLTAENGIEATDTIVLESSTWHSLLRYVDMRLEQQRVSTIPKATKGNGTAERKV